MARIPPKRLVFYLVVIAALGAALVRATSNPGLPHRDRERSVSQQFGSSDFAERGEAPATTPESGARRTGTVGPDEIDEDDALLALNSLSSDDAGPVGEGGSAAGSRATPVPSATPAPRATADGMLYGARDDEDPRGLFSKADEAQQQQIGIDGFIGGGRSFNSQAAGAPQGGAASAATTPVDSGSGWVSGQARGYTMLYAMQPEARAVVESNVSTLLASKVREPYIGVLIDGTFAQDFEYLKTVITRLSKERNLTMVLYLTNGATQRDFKTTTISAPFVRDSPLSFRVNILSNADMQRTFSGLAAQARDLFQFSSQQNPANQNFVSVMLEDNLDVRAYRKMRELAAQQLDGSASFVRSTCLRCVSPSDSGSDADTAGDAREEHTPAKFGELRAGDGFSLDGTGFRYPAESSELGVSPEELSGLIQAGFSRGLRYFGLWRHAWQGANASGDNPHPSERAYVASVPEQESFELSMLRLGLVPEPQEESELDSGVMSR